MTVKSQTFLVAIVFLAAQISCHSEPAEEFRFLSSDDVPRGKVVVYVYRPPSLLGTVGVCNMNLGSELMGALDAGEYTLLFIEPGKTRFETTGSFHAFVTVNLKLGGEYFIKQTWFLNPAGFQPRIENMTKLRAETHLRRCTFVETPPVLEEVEEWLTAAPQVDGVYLLGDPAFESALNSQFEKIRTKHGILPSTIDIESFFDSEFFVGVEIPEETDSASTSHVLYWAKDYWLNDDGSVHST